MKQDDVQSKSKKQNKKREVLLSGPPKEEGKEEDSEQGECADLQARKARGGVEHRNKVWSLLRFRPETVETQIASCDLSVFLSFSVIFIVFLFIFD